MYAYNFSTDWTKSFAVNASRLFKPYSDLPLSYLEIGVFEGRSACFALDQVLLHSESVYCGVDIALNPLAVKNLERHKAKARLIEGESAEVLPSLTERFDIVYIDGSHDTKDVLIDSVNAWRLSKRFILWDDFKNDQARGVAQAVWSFIACIPSKEYKIVCDNWQFGIEKIYA